MINGIEVCSHNNAYLPFSADITDAIRTGENNIRVSVVNDLSTKYPWGKQTIHRGGMWYTPVSGIWQTVWLEPVPDNRIQNLIIRTEEHYADIQIEGCEDGTIEFEGAEIPVVAGRARIRVEKPVLWSPDNPHLLSEFGGFSYKIPKHSFNLDKTYGYRKYEDRASFVKGLQELFGEVAEPR